MRSLFLAILLSLCASQAGAHDPIQPVNDTWFEMLKVPSEGLRLNKGGSCCNYTDCKPRALSVIGPGLYAMQSDNGEWLPFGDNLWITDPEVINANPFLQFVGCIYQNEPVCAVKPPAGG